MGSFFRRIFRFRTLLILVTILSLAALGLAYCSPYVHPDTVGLLPFFGLGYIIAFFANIVLLVIWGFMRSRWALIILLLITLGGRLHFRVFSFGGDEENTNGTELSVLSYNVRLFDLYDPVKENARKTKDRIFQYLQEQNADVVCFQEFYHQDPPTAFVTKDTLVQLLGATDYHERYAHKYKGRQNFGIVLFSKYPIIEKGFVNFPDQENNFNYCIYADIVKESDTFRVYNAHLQSIRLQKDDYALFDEENQGVEGQSGVFGLIRKIKHAYPVRAQQAQLITEHMKHSKYPVIVCGDFNDTPLSYTYNQFNAQLVDAFRNTSFGLGTTYAGNIPAGRIDYIFHSPELGSKNFSIQEEQLSDHYAINCTLFVKNKE